MGYLDRVMEPGEKVVCAAKLSWVSYLPGIASVEVATVA